MTEEAQRNGGVTSGPWLRYPDAAGHTGLSEGHLRRLVSQNRVPHKKVGRSVLFSVPALDEWINSGAASEAA